MDQAKTRLTPTMAIPESRLYTRLDISDYISVRNAFSVDDGGAPGGAPEGGSSPAAPRFDGLNISPGGAGRQSTPCNRLPDSGYVSTNLGARVAATQHTIDDSRWRCPVGAPWLCPARRRTTWRRPSLSYTI